MLIGPAILVFQDSMALQAAGWLATPLTLFTSAKKVLMQRSVMEML